MSGQGTGPQHHLRHVAQRLQPPMPPDPRAGVLSHPLQSSLEAKGPSFNSLLLTFLCLNILIHKTLTECLPHRLH